MHKQVLAFLGAAALSTCAFAAPAAPISVSADGNTVYVAGDATPVVHLTVAEAHEATGAFRLEDGRVLRLSSQSNKLYMELGGKRQRLIPVSRTSFVAPASGAQLELDDLRFPEKVSLSTLEAR
jgi:hypothetical protein